ncbi:MAG: hypothetical protein ACYDGM_10840 [Vulcanimicrobiaceae bacterium]
MTESIFGIVINLNAFGATVRLDSGELASVPVGDVESHRVVYERAVATRKRLAFAVHGAGRRAMVTLVPQLNDEQLEAQITAYLQSTQEWDVIDGRSSQERHFLQKKRRATLFDVKHDT